MRVCDACKSVIENKHKNAIFCSIQCKNKYWQLNNKHKVNKNAEKYRKSDKGKQYRIDNKDKINMEIKKWKVDNAEYQKKLDKKYHKRMKSNKEYLAKRCYNEAKRRAKKLNATINGYDKELKEIYLNRPECHHVDHIVPLQGKEVSGLHVPWNLQYLTAEENLKKSNKLIEE